MIANLFFRCRGEAVEAAAYDGDRITKRVAEIDNKEGFELTKVNKLTMSLQTQRKGGYDDR